MNYFYFKARDLTAVGFVGKRLQMEALFENMNEYIRAKSLMRVQCVQELLISALFLGSILDLIIQDRILNIPIGKQMNLYFFTYPVIIFHIYLHQWLLIFISSMTPYCCSVCSDMFAASKDLILHLIQHCDLNTALKRQPQVGPRKYKRRRKLKPHELEMMSSRMEDDTNDNNLDVSIQYSFLFRKRMKG